MVRGNPNYESSESKRERMSEWGRLCCAADRLAVMLTPSTHGQDAGVFLLEEWIYRIGRTTFGMGERAIHASLSGRTAMLSCESSVEH